MKFQALFAADVNDKGQLKMSAETRRDFDRLLATFKGKKIELGIKEAGRATRSSQANRFYWGVVIPIIAEHLGYTSDELHDALKFKFLRLEAEVGPNDLPKIRSTATLDTKEFAAYLETVMTWAGAEFGVTFPEPGAMEAA